MSVFRLLLAIFVLLPLTLRTAAQEPPLLLSHQAVEDTEPTADPEADFWQGIQGVFIERSVLGPVVPSLRAEVRSRWTKENLYFLFIGPYEALNLKPNPDVTSETYRLWEWDCFEAYVGADFENINRYREFQMSPQGEFLDLDIDASKPRPGHSDERFWDSGMTVKARIDRARKVWYGEMRIPIAAIDERSAQRGNEMRLNLYRQDGRPPQRDFLAWQPPGVWNPHRPKIFGRLRLVGKLTSEIENHNGIPALFINGKLTSPILAAPYRSGSRDFSNFLKAGISIFNIYLRFNWSGPEEYDFTRAENKLDTYLEMDPKALFLPRILLTPRSWWCTEFPNEITMRDDGSAAGMFRRPCHPSFASEKYRELSHKAMVAFLTHLESKYGDHIIGYQPGNGFGGEWLPFNSFWEVPPESPPPKKFGVEDYSPPAQSAFRRWLEKKYHGQVEELRRAWGDPEVTFETAEPPNEVARYSSTHGIFFDPAVSRQVPDFFSFFNDMVADVLLENCRWAKEITNRQKIVGVFYGYLWCNFPNLSVNHAGHLGLSRVLRSPDIDFIASPYTYDNKAVGGPNNSQSLPEAAAIHGKIYFNEVDTETHLHQRQWRWGNSLNNPKNWQETKGLLIRDYGYALTKGFGMWWTDLHGSTFADDKIGDDRIVNLLRELCQVDEKYLETDKRSNADIAVILDEETFTYFGDGEPLFNALLTAQKQWELAYLGAPWEPHLLNDMANPELRDFKLYIFLNTFQVTPEERAAIHERLRRNSATAVWVYAPGYILDDKLSLENMNALTGIRVAASDSAGELRVEISAHDHPYTRSLPTRFAYGTDVNVENIKRWYDHQIYLKDPRDPSLVRDLPGFRIQPRFFGDDPEAQVLGELVGLGKPGLLVKEHSGWTSVYSSAPILPAALLRNIARHAGCHVYSSANDVVYANRNFLCIYAPRGGTRTVRLPERRRVVDLVEGRVFTDGAEEFSLTMTPNSAVLLGLEPPTAP